MALAWYAIESKPACELLAAIHLRRQNFDVWIPQMWTTRKWQGSRLPVTVPIFRRYLFAEVNLDDQRWQAINSTRGVKKMLQFGGARPVAVASRVIASLRDRFGEEPINEREISERMKELVEGDLVRVLDGPFARFPGTVDWTDGANRVKVLVMIFGRSTPVELKPEQLQRIEE